MVTVLLCLFVSLSLSHSHSLTSLSVTNEVPRSHPWRLEKGIASFSDPELEPRRTGTEMTRDLGRAI